MPDSSSVLTRMRDSALYQRLGNLSKEHILVLCFTGFMNAVKKRDPDDAFKALCNAVDSGEGTLFAHDRTVKEGYREARCLVTEVAKQLESADVS